MTATNIGESFSRRFLYSCTHAYSISDGGNWFQCRETFHKQQPEKISSNTIFFICRNIELSLLAASDLFYYVESLLNLKMRLPPREKTIKVSSFK